jgi:hypothetical protein
MQHIVRAIVQSFQKMTHVLLTDVLPKNKTHKKENHVVVDD